MAEVFRKNAFEEIEPQGRPIPRPNLTGWLISVTGQVSNRADTLDAKWLLNDLMELGTELRMKAVEVHQRRSRREECRTAAEEERVTAQASFTLTKGEAEWLRSVAETKDRPLRRLLREAAFERIRKREQMEEIEARLAEWAETATDLHEEEEGEGWAPQHEMRVRRTMKRLAVKMNRFVKEETNWGEGI